MEKFTNQQELQVKTKSLINNIQKGDRYIIMRYSKPVGVLLSIGEYENILKQNCNQCQSSVKNMIKSLKKLNKNDEK